MTDRSRDEDEELTCRELVELVSDYLDGAMAPGQRARFERHVAECDGCTEVVEQFRTTVAATGRLIEALVSDDQRETMRGVFRRWRAGETAPS